MNTARRKSELKPNAMMKQEQICSRVRACNVKNMLNLQALITPRGRTRTVSGLYTFVLRLRQNTEIKYKEFLVVNI